MHDITSMVQRRHRQLTCLSQRFATTDLVDDHEITQDVLLIYVVGKLQWTRTLLR